MDDLHGNSLVDVHSYGGGGGERERERLAMCSFYRCRAARAIAFLGLERVSDTCF